MRLSPGEIAEKSRRQSTTAHMLYQQHSKSFPKGKFGELAKLGFLTKMQSQFNAAWWRTHGDCDTAERETIAYCAKLMGR